MKRTKKDLATAKLWKKILTAEKVLAAPVRRREDLLDEAKALEPLVRHRVISRQEAEGLLRRMVESWSLEDAQSADTGCTTDHRIAVQTRDRELTEGSL